MKSREWLATQFLSLLAVALVVAVSSSNVQAAPQYNASQFNCTSCHNMAPNDSATRDPSSGSFQGRHQTHATSDVNSCVKCHTSAATSYSNAHRDKKIDFVDTLGYERKPASPGFMNQTSIPTPSSCSTAACHTGGGKWAKTTSHWGDGTTTTCGSCHDATPSSIGAAGKHTIHATTYGYTCDKCHTNHTTFTHATSAMWGRNIDVRFTGDNVGGTFTTVTDQCSNLYCHSDGLGTKKSNIVWKGADLDCKGCHNFDLASGSPMTSGAHDAHVNNASVIGANIGCVSCHDATINADNATIKSVALHANATKNFTAASCATCHKDGKTATDKVTGLTWATTTLDCAGCHGTAGTFGAPAYTSGAAGSLTANSHAKHASVAADCVKCHSTTVNAAGTAIISSSAHINGTLTVVEGGTVTLTYVPGTKSCSTSSCHTGGGVVAPKAVLWGATTNCALCHGDSSIAPITTGAHATHLTKGYTCDRCHSTSASNNTTIVPAGKHMDNAATVDGTGITYTNSGTTKNCTVSCHMTASPSWTNAASGDCGTCHAVTKTTLTQGSHAKHINSASVAVAAACNACHTGVTYDGTTATAYSASTAVHYDNSASDYTSCATLYCHSDGTKASGFTRKVEPVWGTPFTATCASCHGDATIAPILTGKHAAHLTSLVPGIGCATCHNTTASSNTAIGTVANHVDQKINVVISTTYGGTYSTNLHVPGAASGTCSTNYCHSDGKAAPTYTTPAWSGAVLDCQGCHATASLSAAHAAHISAGKTCNECHSETAASNTALVGLTVKHINKTRDVAMTSGTYNSTSQGCSTTTCHSSLKAGNVPEWDVLTSGDCGTCHGYTSATLTTNAHAKHIETTGNGPKSLCTACHLTDGQAVTHSGNGVGLNIGIQTATVTGTCSTCHTTPETWNAAAATVTCTDCHTGTGSTIGVAAPLKSLAATTGHGAQGQTCTACHDAASDHISGTLGDNNRLKAALGTDNANCLFCHETAGTITNANMLTMKKHQLTGKGSLCADCHDSHGTSNSMMVNSTINGTVVSFTGNNTFANATNNGVCQVCHTTTDYYRANGTGAAHQDTTSNCLDCHKHNPTEANILAFMPKGGCDACHGYPPIPRNVDLSGIVKKTLGFYSSAKFEDYSGGGGAHIVAAHLSPNVRQGDSFAPCVICHENAEASHVKAMPIRTNIANVTVKLDQKLKFRPDTQVVYSSAKFVAGGTNKSGTCFNVNCHIKPSPKWSTER